MKKNDPWAKMDALMSSMMIPDDPNWFTAFDFIKKYRFKERTGRNLLLSLVNNGKVEKRRGITSTCNTPQTYYRLISK
jgi:hypothetical protein